MESLFQGTSVKSSRIIYTPSSFAKSNLLHLQEVGELQALKPHTSSRKGLLSFLFLLSATEPANSPIMVRITYFMPVTAFLLTAAKHIHTGHLKTTYGRLNGCISMVQT